MHLLVLAFDIAITMDPENENKEKMLNSMEVMASLGGFLMAVQLIFYWLGLFESTSFYVTMLTQSFGDIKEFIFMVILCLASFANAVLILNSAS